MRRRAVVAVLALGVLAAGCGGYGDGGSATLEESVAASMRAVLDRDAPLVEVRAVACDGARPADACRVDLGVGGEVAQVEYRVEVADDGCWQARATRVVVIGAGSATTPLTRVPGASDLRGCAR